MAESLREPKCIRFTCWIKILPSLKSPCEARPSAVRLSNLPSPIGTDGTECVSIDTSHELAQLPDGMLNSLIAADQQSSLPAG